jgi:hypothetical protein
MVDVNRYCGRGKRRGIWMAGGEWAVHAPTTTEKASTTERQITDKNGSVVARTPHFGHGA